VAKFSTSSESRNSKPAKPYPTFPLFPHASGRWAKKVRQKTRFYGRWGNVVAGEVIPVEDVEKSAADAKVEFDRCWPHHSQGREAPAIDAGEGCTVRDLCNAFLTAKTAVLLTGELSQYSFSEYQRTTDRIMAFFGRDRRVDDIRPDEFQSFRSSLAKGCNNVTLNSKVNRCRVVFKFASDRRLIERPVHYGGSFDRPSATTLRKVKNEAGENMLEREDVLKLLDAFDGKPIPVDGEEKPVQLPASPAMKAMTLLGVQAGLGNTDVATLPRSAVDLDKGWIVFPRPKTGVPRRIPLWPETVAALRQALTSRPSPIDEADADLCFITSRGTRYVRLQPSGTEGRFVTINSLSRRFEGVMDKIGIKARRGVNFYTLRHVFETQAGESRDQVAVDAVMGHVDPSMGGQYRERISDDRLKTVVETVRTWLFGAEGEVV
jgi:integrase